MWHVSISLQRAPDHRGGTGYYLLDPERAERIAVHALAGVGGDHEWWLPIGESNPYLAHLRVPTTPAEQNLIPPGLVTQDAGSTGPLRPRTR